MPLAPAPPRFAPALATLALIFGSARAEAQGPRVAVPPPAPVPSEAQGPRVAVPPPAPAFSAAPPPPPALSPGAEAYLTDKGRFLGVLAGWSALSLGSGTALWVQGDRFGRYAGIQFVAWGAANGILAGVGLSQLPDERASLRDGGSLAEKRGKFRRALLVNALADAAYIGAGALLYGLGRNDAVRGTGAGFVVQGAFLLAFDNVGVLSFP